MYPRATGSDSPTTYEEISNTRLVIEHNRGILCVYGNDGRPLVKITGLPKPMPEISHSRREHQEVNIHVVSTEHTGIESAYTGTMQPTPSVGEEALKHAGATLPPRRPEKH